MISINHPFYDSATPYFFLHTYQGVKKRMLPQKIHCVLMRIKHINSEMAYIPILDVYPKY